jgi:hypothetical protein
LFWSSSKNFRAALGDWRRSSSKEIMKKTVTIFKTDPDPQRIENQSGDAVIVFGKANAVARLILDTPAKDGAELRIVSTCRGDHEVKCSLREDGHASPLNGRYSIIKLQGVSAVSPRRVLGWLDRDRDERGRGSIRVIDPRMNFPPNHLDSQHQGELHETL